MTAEPLHGKPYSIVEIESFNVSKNSGAFYGLIRG